MKRESPEAPKSAPRHSRSKKSRKFRRKLRHTKRTQYKVRVALMRLEDSTDAGPQTSSSSGSASQLKGAPLDGRVLSVKRKAIPEEAHRKATKKTRRHTSTSSSSGPGPSHRKETAPAKFNVEQVSEGQDKKTGESSETTPSPPETESSDTSLDSLIIHSEFNNKYQIIEALKSGGYGSVYGGIRKEDNFPVAIKCCPKCYVLFVRVREDEKVITVPHEVAMLKKVGAGPGAEECNITPLLLDWYEVDDQVVLVLERPVPCMDLVDHTNSVGPYLKEADAKIIFRQLVDAALEMLSCRVFHRDIKPDNVLIETGNDMLKARFIDFGYSTSFNPEQVFCRPQGTEVYTSPEWYRLKKYKASPTTAWQLGLTLYSMLNRKRAFASKETVASEWQPRIRSKLSPECRDLLQRLMDKNPQTRLSIHKIKRHPWMTCETASDSRTSSQTESRTSSQTDSRTSSQTDN